MVIQNGRGAGEAPSSGNAFDYDPFGGRGQAPPTTTSTAAASSPWGATQPPPPPSPIAGGDAILVEFPVKGQGMVPLDISASATAPFGFVYHDRVQTPLGPATVLGVSARNLYFQVDGESAASYWSTCRNASDFTSRGFRKLEAHAPTPVRAPTSKAYHDIRSVQVNGRPQTVIMQSLNGPCPIIALANALLLQSFLPDISSMAQSSNFITAEQLRSSLRQHLLRNQRPIPPFSESSRATGTLAVMTRDAAVIDAFRQRLAHEAEGERLLSRFYDGLDCAPIFDTVDGFAADEKALLFSLAGVRLVHGWIMDPSASAVHEELCTRSYDEITLFPYDEAVPQAQKDAAEAFLVENSSQLTEIGLAFLLSQIEPGDVCVLFHNNHFSTLVRVGDRLVTLVTDVAFLGRDQVVFEELTVDGSGVYFDGDGREISWVAMRVLDSFGRRYSVAEIDAAVGHLMHSTHVGVVPSVTDIVTHIDRERQQRGGVGAGSSGGGELVLASNEPPYDRLTPPPPRTLPPLARTAPRQNGDFAHPMDG